MTKATYVTECLPLAVPFSSRIRQCTNKVLELAFIDFNRLLELLKFNVELVQFAALHQGRLPSKRVNLDTVAFIFLPGSINVVLLRLLSLENLLDGRLNLININVSSVSGMLDDVRLAHILLVSGLLRDKVANWRL